MDVDELKFNIDVLIAELNTVLSNFSKAPNRNYSKKFLERKKKLAFKNYNQINLILSENELTFTNTEINFYIKAAR